MGRGIGGSRKQGHGSRHLRWESFELRIGEGPPSVEPVAGKPRAAFFILAGGARIGLRLYEPSSGLEPSPLAELDVRSIGHGKGAAVELSTGNPLLFRDFYSMGCAISDRVQLDGRPASEAISETIASWKSLLRQKMLISEERQVGLIGELLFLQQLAARTNWDEAISAWLGPQSEEHDFCLKRSDVEVKTTTSEQRLHWIGSLQQLVPKGTRPLTVLSVQITPVSASRDSFSLASLVAASLGAAPASQAALLRNQIERQGWADEDASYYGKRFRLRAPCMAIPVNKTFPAILPTTISSLGSDILARVRQVKYQVDLTDLGYKEGTDAYSKRLFGSMT